MRFAFRLTALLCLCVFTLLTQSCAKDINNKEAVKEAVLKRLESVSGLNLANMDVDITSVSFSGNSADAKVAFKAKGSGEAMLNMSYKLERKGDLWEVKSSSGGMGGASQLPAGHPPAAGGQK
ncbi:hypothetical protein [Bryobacter aggregatus]|uniref:hypothetical protein n=1 Tax=Bryobacter aggregatus TaxID=360054 RepID=UPI0012BAB84D|nr:hypothetical protein [Bryobacter aggregatus]